MKSIIKLHIRNTTYGEFVKECKKKLLEKNIEFKEFLPSYGNKKTKYFNSHEDFAIIMDHTLYYIRAIGVLKYFFDYDYELHVGQMYLDVYE